MSYVIRPVESSDAAGVYAVERACFQDPYPSVLLDDLMQEQHDRFFVATEGRQIVGYAVGASRGRDGRIVSVAVDLRHRRKGIGTALLTSVIQQLMKEGVQEVHLEVRKENMVAILFYERMGFRRFSEIKHYYPDGEDAWVLKRAIASLPSYST